jgi:hypothetical protein
MQPSPHPCVESSYEITIDEATHTPNIHLHRRKCLLIRNASDDRDHVPSDDGIRKSPEHPRPEKFFVQCMGQLLADIVAKVRNGLVIIFPP